MGGGSYDYAYHKIAELACDIKPTSPLRKAFKRHLDLVAAACHDIEWVDSGDYSEGYEDKAIRKCLGQNSDALVLNGILNDAKNIHTELGKTIEAMEAMEKSRI